MYGSEHHCEVSSRDLDGIRYDLERAIEDLRHTVSRLEDRIDSLRTDLNDLASRDSQ